MAHWGGGGFCAKRKKSSVVITKKCEWQCSCEEGKENSLFNSGFSKLKQTLASYVSYLLR
jgi:hypothetical protein